MLRLTYPWPRVPNKTHPRFSVSSTRKVDQSAVFPATRPYRRTSADPPEQDYPSRSRLWYEARESLDRGLHRRPMRRPPHAASFLAPAVTTKSPASICKPILQDKRIYCWMNEAKYYLRIQYEDIFISRRGFSPTSLCEYLALPKIELL